MKHEEIDASLRPAEPLPDSLDDGFSPPAQPQPQAAREEQPAQPREAGWSRNSPF